jgi:hypothetical protein
MRTSRSSQRSRYASPDTFEVQGIPIVGESHPGEHVLGMPLDLPIHFGHSLQLYFGPATVERRDTAFCVGVTSPVHGAPRLNYGQHWCVLLGTSWSLD